MNYRIILLFFVCFLIHQIFIKDNKKEEYANDFNHYAWMNDYGIKMREEALKKIYKFYGMNSEGEVLDHKEKKEGFKCKEGKSELEKEDKKRSIVDVKDFQLENTPKSCSEKKSLSDFLEVDEYNCGSGNLIDINKSFESKDKKKYAEELKTLYSRGGNVHIKKE